MIGWLGALEEAYEYAYRSKLAELNGKRTSSWRADGLHSWSYLWGKIDAMEPDEWDDLVTQAPEQLAVFPKLLLDVAEGDALAEFTHRIFARARAPEETETEEEEEDVSR